ncbi:MAG TPA: histone deacetylase, partial [Flavipsychrobacter sp.]
MFTIAYDTIYTHPLPDGHRFPMLKYELIPQQLLHEGVITREHIFAPNAAAEQTIMLTHEKNYWQKMQALQLTDREMRAIGFPLSAALVSREITIMQGTV